MKEMKKNTKIDLKIINMLVILTKKNLSVA